MVNLRKLLLPLFGSFFILFMMKYWFIDLREYTRVHKYELYENKNNS